MMAGSMQPEVFYKQFNVHGHGQAFMAQYQSMGTHGRRPVHVGLPAMSNPGQVSVAPFGQASITGIPPQANQQFIYPTPMHSQFVQPGQLPQITGNLFHSDHPTLMWIPMLFNHREMIWNPQHGILVPPNTGTFFSGCQIIHHGGMPMPNGYGPNPNIAHAQPQTRSPSGSNYTDSNSCGSRDNLAAHEPHVPSPGNHVDMPPLSRGMVNGGIICGYPQHMGHMTVHQAVGGPEFQPGIPNSYAQGQGGCNLHPGQGVQHDNANNAGRLLIDGQMLEGVDRKPIEQGSRDQEGSAAQSRSSSLGPAFESEQPHDVDDNGGRKIDGENYSHSSSLDEAELPVGGDDHNVEDLEALSRAQSRLESVTDQVEPNSAIQQVYQGSGHNSPTVDLAGRGGSAVDGAYHDIGKDLSRTSSMSSEARTFTAENNGNNTRGTGSPFVDQGRHSSHTPDHSVMKESDEGTSPNSNQPVCSDADTAAQQSSSKSMADMALRIPPERNALAGPKTTWRPPIIPSSEPTVTQRCGIFNGAGRWVVLFFSARFLSVVSADTLMSQATNISTCPADPMMVDTGGGIAFGNQLSEMNECENYESFWKRWMHTAMISTGVAVFVGIWVFSQKKKILGFRRRLFGRPADKVESHADQIITALRTATYKKILGFLRRLFGRPADKVESHADQIIAALRTTTYKVRCPICLRCCAERPKMIHQRRIQMTKRSKTLAFDYEILQTGERIYLFVTAVDLDVDCGVHKGDVITRIQDRVLNNGFLVEALSYLHNGSEVSFQVVFFHKVAASFEEPRPLVQLFH